MIAKVRDRFWHNFLLLALIALSWLLMMVVHECGHLLNGLLSGARLERLVLHPLRFSRTDFSKNPSPAFVAWGGPAWGCLFPVGSWLVARTSRWRREYLLRFFAGFCLIANGAYLGFGWLERAGDAGDLMRHGTPTLVLLIFGAIAIPCGLALWNGIGPHFGFGRPPRSADRITALAVAMVLLITVVLELLLPVWP
jgi:Peptidase M50B-like